MSDAELAPTGAAASPPGPERGLSARWWLLPVLLWPLLLLAPCLIGVRTFLPYDTAQFPPAGLRLLPDELAAIRADSNFDVTETPIWFVPELQRARRTIVEEGSLPNWNPTARTGTALLPHGHDGIWYPPVWPALFAADPADWLGWVALLNLAIAGTLMFGFLRSLHLRPAAAALGALGLCMSTTLCANAHNFPRLSSLVWLPGMLWGLRAAAETHGPRRWRALCGFAVCFALTWIGGFPPYALPCALVATAYGLSLWWRELRFRGRREGLRRGATTGLAAIVGVLLCCHYLLPAFAFFGQSARTLDPGLEQISQTAFDDYGFLGWLVPDLFGRPDSTVQLPYDNAPLPLLLGNRTSWQGATLRPRFNSTEYALFGGSLMLWLALLGLGARAATHRWFPLLMLLFCCGMATFRWPFGHLFALPGVRVVPPMRFLGPCSLLLAWLAAQGMHLALAGTARRRVQVGVALAAITVITALAFGNLFANPKVFGNWHLSERLAAHYAPSAPDPASITPERIEQLVLHGPDGTDYAANGAALASSACYRAAAWHLAAGVLLLALLWRPRAVGRAPRVVAAAAVLLTGVDLVTAARTFDRGIRRTQLDWTPVHGFLVQQRLAMADQGGFMVARAAPGAATALVPPQSMAPGTLGPLGVRDLQVYTYFDGRSIQPIERLLATAIGPDAAAKATGKGYVEGCLPDDPRILQHPLLDLLGVRFLFATTPLQHGGERVGPHVAGPGGEFFVYERSTALPRAFVVGDLQTRASDDDVIAALVDPAFRPRAKAFALVSDLDGLERPRADPAAEERTVHFAVDHATAIELRVEAGAAGWLVLADTWSPGWTAAIDGNEVPVLRVDHAMRAVAVPAGACTVSFRYRAPGQLVGMLLAGVGLVVLLAVLWRCRFGAGATSGRGG